MLWWTSGIGEYPNSYYCAAARLFLKSCGYSSHCSQVALTRFTVIPLEVIPVLQVYQ